jgi:hypothetical protein
VGAAIAVLLSCPVLAATYHVQDVRNFTVRCSTINAGDLEPDVAKRYGLTRDEGYGVLSCSVQKVDDAGKLQNVPMPMTATYNLIGQAPRSIDNFREILEGKQVSMVGSYRVSSSFPIRFEVTIGLPDTPATVQFFDEDPGGNEQ